MLLLSLLFCDIFDVHKHLSQEEPGHQQEYWSRSGVSWVPRALVYWTSKLTSNRLSLQLIDKHIIVWWGYDPHVHVNYRQCMVQCLRNHVNLPVFNSNQHRSSQLFSYSSYTSYCIVLSLLLITSFGGNYLRTWKCNTVVISSCKTAITHGLVSQQDTVCFRQFMGTCHINFFISRCVGKFSIWSWQQKLDNCHYELTISKIQSAIITINPTHTIQRAENNISYNDWWENNMLRAVSGETAYFTVHLWNCVRKITVGQQGSKNIIDICIIYIYIYIWMHLIQCV